MKGLKKRMSFNKIRALIMDVDGTLTDGGIYVGQNSEIMKRFDVKDGYGINNILPQMGILPIIITGRKSEIVFSRCKELGIVDIIQGSKDKVCDMNKILFEKGINLSQVAYIGDDLNDLECMKIVGIRGCPADAVEEIKDISDVVTFSKGGYGAVREFITWIKNNQMKE